MGGEVGQLPHNVIGGAFWRRVIERYTEGRNRVTFAGAFVRAPYAARRYGNGAAERAPVRTEATALGG